MTAAGGTAPRRRRRGGFLRWQWDRSRERRRHPGRDVRYEVVPHAVAPDRAIAGELRVTWIGHASVLLQTQGGNLLLDPILSERASPLQWIGPARHAPPGVQLHELPSLDAILVTHDHYDHLDRLTIEVLASEERPDGRGATTLDRVRRLWGGERGVPPTVHGDPPLVVTPTGYREWMLARGVRRHRELGWWQTAVVPGRQVGTDRGGAMSASANAPADHCGGAARVTAVPVRHWTRRSFGERRLRLWCGYLVESAGFRVFFCGDSGYFDGFHALGERLGPLDLVILPIGAYEPRWFMARSHMSPEEAVRAYRALGGSGLCMGVHWGTFVLTDEPLDEPPVKMREAWSAAGLAPERLWIPRHGETRTLRRALTPASERSSAAASG